MTSDTTQGSDACSRTDFHEAMSMTCSECGYQPGPAPIPLSLSIAPVQHVKDGGDGNPWTRWALIGETSDVSDVIVTSWAKDGAPMGDVLAAVFLSLRTSGGALGGLF